MGRFRFDTAENGRSEVEIGDDFGDFDEKVMNTVSATLGYRS